MALGRSRSESHGSRVAPSGSRLLASPWSTTPQRLDGRRVVIVFMDSPNARVVLIANSSATLLTAAAIRDLALRDWVGLLDEALPDGEVREFVRVPAGFAVYSLGP